MKEAKILPHFLHSADSCVRTGKDRQFCKFTYTPETTEADYVFLEAS
jgi:hypothetical protein